MTIPRTVLERSWMGKLGFKYFMTGSHYTQWVMPVNFNRIVREFTVYFTLLQYSIYYEIYKSKIKIMTWFFPFEIIFRWFLQRPSTSSRERTFTLQGLRTKTVHNSLLIKEESGRFLSECKKTRNDLNLCPMLMKWQMFRYCITVCILKM